jgi:hypothetical protein
LEVLKPIVQDERGRIESLDGHEAGAETIGADDDRDSGNVASQHLRFVAGLLHRHQR